MHRLDFLIESHWSVQRPNLDFFVNGELLSPKITIHSILPCQENLIYTLQVKSLHKTNVTKIILSGKTDAMITSASDHWVNLRNIAVDDVYADEMLQRSEFRHTMPDIWVETMSAKGYDIQSVYQPGSEMRLNGMFLWQWQHPFELEKLLHLWK